MIQPRRHNLWKTGRGVELCHYAISLKFAFLRFLFSLNFLYLSLVILAIIVLLRLFVVFECVDDCR